MNRAEYRRQMLRSAQEAFDVAWEKELAMLMMNTNETRESLMRMDFFSYQSLVKNVSSILQKGSINSNGIGRGTPRW